MDPDVLDSCDHLQCTLILGGTWVSVSSHFVAGGAGVVDLPLTGEAMN